MTDTPEEAGLPPMPPALARAVALQLVTRHRLRLADSRDGRLGSLGPEYELCAAAWTGSRAALVGFYTPPSDPAAAAEDVRRRIDEALRWGIDRLRVQGAQRCDILLIPMAPVPAIPRPQPVPGLEVGVVWADASLGETGVVLPPPPGMPSGREVRAIARSLREGVEAPTLAAVDLAERQTVQQGTVAPMRRQMLTTPVLTFGLIATFVVVYLVESYLVGHYADGLLGAGALAAVCPTFSAAEPTSVCFGVPGSEWWRFVSTAFLHQPGGLVSAHLLMNSFAMYMIGRLVEQLYGRLMLLGVFLLTAVAGNLASVGATVLGLPRAFPWGIGASGGIMGLLGLLLMLGRFQGKHVPAGLSRAILQSVILSAGLTLFLGLTIANVNNYAHAGGFLAGAALGVFLPPVPAIGGRDLRMWEKVVLVAVIAASSLAMLFAVANGLDFVQHAQPALFPGG